MKSYFLLACGAVMLCASAMPAQAADNLQAGEWRLTSKRDRNGVVTERPPVTRCISAEQANDIPRQTPPDMSRQPNCTASDFKRSGKDVSWRMRCTGTPTVETAVQYTVPDPQHYAATFKTTVTVGSQVAATSVLSVQGARTGECPK